MNKKKRIIILLGVLAVFCLATVAVSQYQVYQEKISTTEEVILTIDSDDVTAVTWVYEDDDQTGYFAFTRDGDEWVFDDDESFPTDADAIEDLLEIFEEFTAAFIIEDVEDYSQYGLDDPSASITITLEDETEYTIDLGDFSSLDNQRYVSIGDGNAYLVSSDPMDTYAVSIEELILNDSTPAFDFVSAFTVESGDETLSVTYIEDSDSAYSEDDVYYTEIDGEQVPLNATAVSALLNNIEATSLDEYITYNVTEDELTEYGFDDPELIFTVEYTDTVTDDDGEETEESGTFVIYVARSEEMIAAAEEEDSDDDEDESYCAYVRVGDSAIIYGIYETDYEDLLASSYLDLCHTEVMPFDESEITSVEIVLSDETYVFTVETDDDENQVWYYEEEEISAATFTSELTGLDIEELTDELDADTEEISLLVTLSNENYSEIEITIYRYDGEYCLAVVNGEPYGFVSRSDAMDLVEAVNTIIL